MKNGNAKNGNLPRPTSERPPPPRAQVAPTATNGIEVALSLDPKPTLDALDLIKGKLIEVRQEAERTQAALRALAE